MKELQLGREYPPKGEFEATQTILNAASDQVKSLYPRGEMLRQAHPKMHACLNAEFEVMSDIPSTLKHGVFKEPGSYKAHIRFSNASRGIKPDSKKDIRGMAVKVYGVKGDFLLEDSVEQDFVTITHPVFVAKNVEAFSKTIKAMNKGKLALILYLLNPLHFGVLKRVAASMKKFQHLFNTQFWSTTPYQLGTNDQAVKYRIIPAGDHSFEPETTKGENFLRQNMVHTLSEESASFHFQIQLQENANTMPIEDPTKEWSSSFTTVAKINIPQQKFDTGEMNELGEKLSFNPWHSISDHRPLGGINRARKTIYWNMYKLRKEQNNF